MDHHNVVRGALTAGGTGNVTFSTTGSKGRPLSVLPAGWAGGIRFDDPNGVDWELSMCTALGSNVFSRDTLLHSSTGSAVNLAVGTIGQHVAVAQQLNAFVSRASLSGTYAVGSTLTAKYPADVVGTIQFTRTSLTTPYAKTAISGAVASAVNSLAYTITSADAGYAIGVDCSGQVSTLTGGTVPAATASKAVISSAPAIVGTPTVGTALSITAGTFTGGSPAPTISRIIYANGSPVSTSGSYTPVTADIGSTFSVSDIATNSAGSTVNPSATSAACVAAPSAATAVTAPAVTGTPVVGSPLTITAGTFSGANPAATITRVIYSGGTQVATGSNTTTYTPVSADVGKVFTVDDIATNASGTVHNMSGNSAACSATPVFRSIYTQDLGTNNQYSGRVAVRDSQRTKLILRNKNAYPLQYSYQSANNYTTNNPYNYTTLPPGQEVEVTGIDQWWVQPLTYTTEALTSSGKTATVTLTNHGFVTGQTIYMYAAGSATGYRYGGVITVIDANTFTYQTATADLASAGTNGKFCLTYLTVEVEITGTF